jgi:CheY-like chemotaxis protein
MKKILIAEDNPVNMELLREILGAARYEIIEAEDGYQALMKIEEFFPSLVLLDVNMPIMDGLAVIRNLREDPRFFNLPVIALTAYAMKDDQDRMIAAGFDSYISKPVDAFVLVKEIERLTNYTFPKKTAS